MVLEQIMLLEQHTMVEQVSYYTPNGYNIFNRS
jgi:hypothetical protein